MRYENEPFKNTNVELDGNEFFNCSFDNVTLIYNGGTPPTITGCSFGDFRITFGGCAATTVAFMTALYHGGFQPVIEGTINNIRKNIVQEGNTSAMSF